MDILTERMERVRLEKNTLENDYREALLHKEELDKRLRAVNILLRNLERDLGYTDENIAIINRDILISNE